MGFSGPHKQQVIFCIWHPHAEDAALRYADDGVIDDDDTTPAERAAERAARFDGYQINATARARAAQAHAESLTEGIPLGQPILVGHHSEKHARRDAARIESAMHAWVEETKSADYWRSRAQGVLRHAEYRETPAVIHRRIKKLEADLRKWQREREMDAARRQYVAYDFMRDNLHIDILEVSLDGLAPADRDQVDAHLAAVAERIAAHADRWIEHIENRLTFERTLLDEKGGLAAGEKTPTKGGAVLWGNAWRLINKVNKGVGGAIRSVTVPPVSNWSRRTVLAIEDVKGILTPEEYQRYLAGDQTFAPPPVAPRPAPVVPPVPQVPMMPKIITVGGVDQLFQTPPDLIERMLICARIGGGMRVLEPSAGTGSILRELCKFTDVLVDWCEINHDLRSHLETQGRIPNLVASDFLEYHPGPVYDRIVMNPPFAHNADTIHVRHAYDLLVPGGRLVAIMSEHAFFAGDAADWLEWFISETGSANSQKLPSRTFGQSGTNVASRLVVIDK